MSRGSCSALSNWAEGLRDQMSRRAGAVDLHDWRARLPLDAPPALDILDRRRMAAGDAANRSLHQQSTAADFVFPATRGQGHAVGVRKVFESICKEAKLENLRIHDLRHSFASFAIADGASFFWWPNFLAMRVPEPRSDMRI
jgi:integrase